MFVYLALNNQKS